MRKIVYIILSIIIGVSLFVLFASKEINRQLKSVFLSNAISVYNTFERDFILLKYNSDEKLRYICFSDLNYGISENDVDLKNSYIAFEMDNDGYKIYITVIGNGRYKNYSLENKLLKDITISNIKESKNTFKENIKKIKAIPYKEE